MPEPLRWNMTLPNGQPLRWNMGPEYVWGGNVPQSAYPTNTMSLPNVAVAFPQTNRDNIKTDIATLKTRFPVLVQVGPADRKGLATIAQGREPYVAEAFTDAKDNPATVPPTIDMAAWALVEQQFAALDEAESELMAMLELVRGVKAVAGDYRYKNVRRHYDYLGGNMDVLPGAKTIHDKIAGLYAKQGSKAKAPSGGTGGNP